MAMTAILGIGLIYNMSQIYRIPAAQGWNTWRTNIGFIVSTLLLGISVMTPILAYESKFTGIQVSSAQWMIFLGSILIFLFAELAMLTKRFFSNPLVRVRVRLILIGITVIAIGLLISKSHVFWISLLLFLIVLSEEVIGRWIFYASRLADAK
jgi:DMSO reductase anchor subunit